MYFYIFNIKWHMEGEGNITSYGICQAPTYIEAVIKIARDYGENNIISLEIEAISDGGETLDLNKEIAESIIKFGGVNDET